MATYALGKIGMNLRGTYDASATYHKLDVVTYNGSSYAALQICTGVPVTNTEYWQQLCIGNAESYTTNEVCTGGTWIDGKPIYRRVFVAENVGSSTQHVFADAIDGLETVASMVGMFANANAQFQIPYVTNGAWTHIAVRADGKVQFDSSDDFSIAKLIVVVDYTKGA